MNFKRQNVIFFTIILLISSFMLDAQVPKVGDQISHFSAKDENGNLWKLKDHLGKNFLVVYFYPAAMTGG